MEKQETRVGTNYVTNSIFKFYNKPKKQPPLNPLIYLKQDRLKGVLKTQL